MRYVFMGVYVLGFLVIDIEVPGLALDAFARIRIGSLLWWHSCSSGLDFGVLGKGRSNAVDGDGCYFLRNETLFYVRKYFLITEKLNDIK